MCSPDAYGEIVALARGGDAIAYTIGPGPYLSHVRGNVGHCPTAVRLHLDGAIEDIDDAGLVELRQCGCRCTAYQQQHCCAQGGPELLSVGHTRHPTLVVNITSLAFLRELRLS